MKQFIKMMFASTLGVFIALGIFFFLSISALIGIVSSMGSSSYSPRQNTVYKITLDGTLNDNTINNPFMELFSQGEKSLSLSKLLDGIEIAKNNNNISGIYLEAKTLSTGSANLEALRRALIDFKESGKFVVAYGDVYTQGCYYLCSVADKVFLNPQGMIEVVGMYSQTAFYKGIMEKLGIDMEIFKVGTYKGAVEPYMLDKLSDANREQIESYISSTWNNVSKGIAESRGITVKEVNYFADEALVFDDPINAIEYGFVNELMYKKEAEEFVKELAGQTGKKLQTAGTDKVVNIKRAISAKPHKIAVVYAEGEIVAETSYSIYNNGSSITESLAEELEKLKDDKDVKAVVLRVNSPGGSAYVSEQIWKQIVELKAEKPVVVSMGSVAASGGYYISCAANKIVAEANTLTGSIGVFAVIPNFTETYKKIGISTDMVKTNKYADLGDISRPFSNDERTIFQQYVNRTYDLFLTRCADGRGKSKEDIDNIGQGRVWTGEQALSNGLVDEIGGIDKAIQIAADLAGISEYNIEKVTGSNDVWMDFLAGQFEEIKYSLVKNTLGTDFEMYKTINSIRSASGIQMRLPYDIKPL